MKDSAWYHKLWRKKLTELPLKEDAGSAWAGMKNMLDAQMPVNSGIGHAAGTHIAKSAVTKIAALLVYILPAAAMIGTAVYFTAPILSKKNQARLKEKHSHSIIEKTAQKEINPVLIDSTILILDSAGTVQNDSLQKINISDSLKENLVKESRRIVEEKSIHKSSPDSAANPATAISKNVNLRVANLQRTDWKKSSDEKASGEIGENKPAISNRYPLTSNIDLKSALSIQGFLPSKRNNILRRLPASGKPKTNIKKSNKKTQKFKSAKSPKSLKSEEIISPPFDYGIEAGLNKGNQSSFYLGAFGTLRLKTRWLLNGGIRITSETLSGSYTSAATYFFPDSLQPFKITDKRKILILSLPLTIEYRLSKMISLNVGPVVSFPIKQSGINYQLGPLINQRDTTSSKSMSVDTILKRTIVNKINLGITGGISFRIQQFYLDARYQKNLNPYKVSSDLGSYQQNKGFLQLGIRYKFKK